MSYQEKCNKSSRSNEEDEERGHLKGVAILIEDRYTYSTHMSPLNQNRIEMFGQSIERHLVWTILITMHDTLHLIHSSHPYANHKYSIVNGLRILTVEEGVNLRNTIPTIGEILLTIRDRMITYASNLFNSNAEQTICTDITLITNNLIKQYYRKITGMMLLRRNSLSAGGINDSSSLS